MPRRAVLIAAMLLVAGAAIARAAIRVAEDEVIFTLTRPGAKDVYLVGDFNNWNPTVERMLREDGRFEISLFLVEGTYRYKFVVDGVFMDDPDNPGRDERGSVLTLIEQAGGLILSTEEPGAPSAAPKLTPGFRYIGRVRSNSLEESRNEQQVDLSARLHRDRLKGEVVLKSTNDTWKGRLDEVETKVNRGFLDAKLSGFTLRGYENDSTWASKDPVSLIGSDGIFDYNSGFLRHGGHVAYTSTKFIARFLYDDVTSRVAITPAAPPPLSGADTSFYDYAGNIGDADRAAAEVYFDAGDVKGGVVLRENSGLHPGTAGEVTDSVTTLYATREDRRVSLYWLEVSGLPVVENLAVTWGQGSTDVSRFAGTTAGAGITGIRGASGRARLQESTRLDGRLRGTRGIAEWRVEYDYVRFDFEQPFATGRAQVHRPTVAVKLKSGDWNAGLSIMHTHQDYGSTPDALYIDSPERNHWLNAFDNFTVANIVGIDEGRFTEWRADGGWDRERVPWLPLRVSGEAGLVSGGSAEKLLHAWAQALVEWNLDRGFYVEMDGRVAGYRKPSWSLEETFLTGYVETGYRNRWLWLSVGWGFDPYILDRITNDYARIGRTRLLRDSLQEFTGRSSASAVGQALGGLERELQGYNDIYLECIVRF